MQTLRLVRRQRSVVQREVRQLTPQRREPVGASSEEKRLGVIDRHLDFGVDLRGGFSVQPRRDPFAVSNHHDVIPRPRRDDRRPGDRPVAAVAVEEQKSSDKFFAIGPADPQVIPGSLPVAVGATREEIGGHRPDVTGRFTTEPQRHRVAVTKKWGVAIEPTGLKVSER